MRGGLLEVMNCPWGRLSERTRAYCSEPSSASDTSQSRYGARWPGGSGGKGSEELVDGDWERSDTPAGGVVHRVGDRGGYAHDSDLAEALAADRVELVRFADEDDVEVGHVGVDRDQVVAERRVGDATGGGVEDRLLEHRHSDAHHGGSDDLAACQLLVEDAAPVDGRHDPRDPQQSEFSVYTHFGEPCGERAGRCHACTFWPRVDFAIRRQLIQFVAGQDVAV